GAVHGRLAAGARGVAAPHLHAHSARLAGRRQRHHSHPRPCGASHDQPEGREMTRAAGRLLSTPWIWSFAGAFLVWLAAIVFTGGYGAGGMITAALSLAIFAVVVGVGQMFVITLGPGNVDLSLPAN